MFFISFCSCYLAYGQLDFYVFLTVDSYHCIILYTTFSPLVYCSKFDFIQYHCSYLYFPLISVCIYIFSALLLATSCIMILKMNLFTDGRYLGYVFNQSFTPLISFLIFSPTVLFLVILLPVHRLHSSSQPEESLSTLDFAGSFGWNGVPA